MKSRRMRWAGHVESIGRGEVCIGFWWENLRERAHWEDPSIDGRIMLRQIFRKWNVGSMDWIELAQDRDRWWTLVNVVMNLRVP
jgi:hypothetical protein